MRRTALQIVVTVLALSIAGCASMGSPKLREARIDPEVLKPGDTAVITVKLADRPKLVDRVIGVVQEDTRMKFRLQDEGEDPDEKAGDGIWSIRVDVPFMAPPGDFTLEITAYDASGQAILVKGQGGERQPLSAICRLAIRYPADQQQ
jgi:hypothetical protein